MAIDPALIKWYQCTVWAEGSAHGGDIDTGNEITSGEIRTSLEQLEQTHLLM